MNSEDSSKTVFNTISQFIISDIETPDNSRTLGLDRHAKKWKTQTPEEKSPAPSFYTHATPIFSPKVSDQPDPSRPVTEELEHALDTFITLQQQLQNNNTLKILNLAHSVSSCESSNPASTVEETRARRVFKRKHPNAQTFYHPEHPDCFPFTPSTLIRKNFLEIIYLVSHKTHIVAPTKTN